MIAMGTNRVKPFAAVEQAASERAGVLELCLSDAQKCRDDASERVVGAAAGREREHGGTVCQDSF